MTDNDNQDTPRRDGLHEAIDRWIEDEMWKNNQSRPPDLLDAFVFVRAYREGERNGRKEKQAIRGKNGND